MSVDFSQLSKPSMIEEIDFETLLAERKQDLIQKWDSTEDQEKVAQILNRESEPLTKYLEENTYRETILRSRINQAALATLLAFATNTDLDAVVANYGVTRKLISAATDSASAVYESDDDLRHRASLVFDSLSVAGPTSAYEYHALTADGRVGDAKASSPAPAEVLVTILQKDTTTGQADDALIQIVNTYLSDETRRPVADRLTIKSVEPVSFDLSATIYTNNLPESDTLLANANQTISNYLSVSRKIGRSIYLSKIFNLLHVSGVEHVVIDSPSADVIISETQVAYCNSIKLVTGAAS